MQTIKVLITDDHLIVREGLRSLLTQKNDQYHFLIEEAETGEEAIAKVKKQDYDIILMDYRMPKMNGAETTQAILALKPRIPILALSNHNELLYIKNMLEAGAKGYIMKDIKADELIKAIITVLSGKNYFSNEVAQKLLHDKEGSFRNKKTPSGKELSEREVSVLKLVDQGDTSTEMAEKLFISLHTIAKYRKQLKAKMQVKNVASLLKRARDLGFLE
ncbi:MAG: response regulator transcription factor [Bacteroidetes bacterium]|nr:response regulator transcription factor [Bacteroidota bacterium]